ncbi:DoxX family protein [Chryseobacterium sp. MFBS3-17]|uniref:DoxX family protein n=1 Tax=Chryseobacterium sp. MFBS3-17 TaxID=2886689 RepID=UPI001D0DC210|nr:DoxX family protein [Chryseobacterium sp. MFBS3-17]MCC2590243.1 DoxX family protein [Chryseobacterium sp. MFBS3-17]
MGKNNDLGVMILRVALGFLMLLHGIAKIQHGTGFIEGVFEQNGLPKFFAYAVYIGEIIAPLMLIVGYRTRLASVLLGGTMVVVVLTAAMDKLGQLTEVGAWAIEVQALFFFGALALFFTGGGKFSASVKSKWD